MAVVGLVALLICGEQMRERSLRYRNRAASHEELEGRINGWLRDSSVDASISEVEAEDRKDLDSFEDPDVRAAVETRQRQGRRELKAEWEEKARVDRLWAEWHTRMKAKYRRGQWHPWESVTTEPTPSGDLSPEMQLKLYGPE